MKYTKKGEPIKPQYTLMQYKQAVEKLKTMPAEKVQIQMNLSADAINDIIKMSQQFLKAQKTCTRLMNLFA